MPSMWLQGAEQQGPGIARGQAGDVEAIVVAVDEVDVGVAGGSEENLVAGGLAAGGVGGIVVGTEIGLEFDDAPREGGRPLVAH